VNQCQDGWYEWLCTAEFTHNNWVIEVKNKARVLDVTNMIPEVRKLRFKVGGSGQGQVDNEMRIKVNIQT